MKIVPLGSAEEDALHLGQILAADEFLDVASANLVRNDADFVDRIVGLESLERVADDRPPRELHQLLRPGERTSLANAACKNHCDSTRCHLDRPRA